MKERLLEFLKNENKSSAQLAEEIGAKSSADFAKLMPAAIKQLKGLADGKTVKQAVEKILR